MIVAIRQTRYLLGRMIARQEADFKKFGGVRERMYTARSATRGEAWDKTIYSWLDAAGSAEELAARAAEIKRKVDQTVFAIRKRKGWG